MFSCVSFFRSHMPTLKARRRKTSKKEWKVFFGSYKSRRVRAGKVATTRLHYADLKKPTLPSMSFLPVRLCGSVSRLVVVPKGQHTSNPKIKKEAGQNRPLK
jgi:hypothetical protein